MSIQDLGAIGEFVSSIAVVISLIYLAGQIRENTRTQRITSAQNVMTLSATNNTLLVLNPQLFEVITKAISNLDGESSREGAGLSPEENRQFGTFMRSIFAAHWQAHYLHASGVLDDEIFKTYERRTKDLLSRPSTRHWWQANKTQFSEGYQKYVDQIMSVGA